MTKLIKELLKKVKNLIIKEEQESKIQKLIDKAREEYPELFMNDKFNGILTVYHQLKHLEREKWYFGAIVVLTLVTAWVGWQNLQLQKPYFVTIVGQNCPDESYGYVLHTFSFANTGKSSGSITVGYKNNKSVTISFRGYNSPIEYENPQSLIVRDGDSTTYNILANPFYDAKTFNFTIYTKTSDWCLERICYYKRADNNPNRLEKIDKDQWISCPK